MKFASFAQDLSGTKARLCRFAMSLLALSGLVHGQTQPNKLVSFQEFIASASTSTLSDYTSRPNSHVKDGVAFDDMRQHILDLYQGVQVNHSFLLEGHAYDCVPVEQQASLRMYGDGNIATPPPAETMRQTQNANITPTTQIDAGSLIDAFGNATRCEDNTIPMRRVTLEDMTQFNTLRDFFAKGRTGAGDSYDPNMPEPGDAYVHHYATAYKNVTNLGGNSDLNLWNPKVDTSKGDAMSLSQQWYSAGSPLQTAEVGWQVQPNAWGTNKAVLFIYYTADDYNNTGCYNLDCGAFVQVANDWYFGDGFTHYSKFGGTQYYFQAEFYLYQGNWWLELGGEWVGYYVGSIYGSGAMRHHATDIEFGGEVAGLGHWPQMGSGKWPSKGFEYAAYQSDIWYFNTSKKKVWPHLTIYQDSPQCYKVGGLTYNPTSFYFGGPGGGGC